MKAFERLHPGGLIEYHFLLLPLPLLLDVFSQLVQFILAGQKRLTTDGRSAVTMSYFNTHKLCLWFVSVITDIRDAGTCTE